MEWQDQDCRRPRPQPLPAPPPPWALQRRLQTLGPTSKQVEGKRDFSLGLLVGYYNEESFFKKIARL